MKLLLAFLVGTATISCAYTSADERRLVSALMGGENENYLNIKPTVHYSDTLNLKLSFYLTAASVDDSTHSVSLFGLTKFNWIDMNKRWNPTEFGNVTKLHMNPHKMWTPDLRLYNGVTKPDLTNPVVAADGLVLWVVPGMASTHCSFNATDSEYSCKYMFGVWLHKSKEIKLEVGEMSMDHYKPQLSHKVISISATRHQIQHVGDPEKYDYIVTDVKIKKL